MSARKHYWRNRLFAYFADKHGRDLLNSELEEIAAAIDKGPEAITSHLEEEHGIEVTDEDIIAITQLI